MAGVLGQPTPAPRHYSPEILVPIPRAGQRALLGIDAVLPFAGMDVWHLYELSWLDGEGRPVNHAGVLTIPASSASTVESKSLKLYLNSLNFHRFDNVDAAVTTICRDVSARCGSSVTLTLLAPHGLASITGELDAELIDTTEVPDSDRERALGALRTGGAVVEATWQSHSLRSLCPVTGQPDWASLAIRYRGPRADRAVLFAYLLGYREHQDFHEHCVERIYVDLFTALQPEYLAVTAYYLRRGGIDITPWRYSHDAPPWPSRLGRQ